MAIDIPEATRHHLTADPVVVHDVLADALAELRGIHSRTGAQYPRGSAGYSWALAQMVAVDRFRDGVDVTDRAAMLDALDTAGAEIRRLISATAA